MTKARKEGERVFCAKRGTELPDEANFCWKCGLPQKTATVKPGAQALYEYCSIDKVDHAFQMWWEARVDEAVVARSRTVSAFAIAKFRQANLELVSELSSQGWEQMTADEEGYVRSMRRVKRS